MAIQRGSLRTVFMLMQVSMRQRGCIAKRAAPNWGAHDLPIDEKFPARANVRYPISGI
jgi:hypothetical protein